MPSITRIVAGKRNPSRANIYLDGQFAFALSIDEVVKNHLKPKEEITDEKVKALKAEDSASKIYGKILNFLSFRPRSVKEVRDRLYQYEVKGVSEQNLLIEKLKNRGYLDDLAFAKWFVASRNTHKLRSPRMIRQELAGKGISHEIVEQAMEAVQDERETMQGILHKKLGSRRQLTAEERQKMRAYLVRLGFAWDKVKEVVKSWESE